MKFVWYIVNLEDGSVEGTNDTEQLQESGLPQSDSHVVIHRDSGMYVDPETGSCDQEIQAVPFGVEEDEESNDIEGTGDDE